MAQSAETAPLRPLKFKDFVPMQIQQGGLFSEAVYESLELTLRDLDAWIDAHPDFSIMTVETVVLPNIHQYYEHGSVDPELQISQSDGKARWHQFFRVWYR